MKKVIPAFVVLALCIMLSACAPKTNDKINSTNDVNTSPTPIPKYNAYTLYYPNIDENNLIKETRELQMDDRITDEEIILNALKKGPIGDDLKSPLSPTGEVISIKTVSGLCTIDFSKNFLAPSENNEDTRLLMIQSIVHSLCALPNIQQVKINVNGETDVNLDEQVNLSQPLSPDESFLKK